MSIVHLRSPAHRYSCYGLLNEHLWHPAVAWVQQDLHSVFAVEDAAQPCQELA